MSHNSGGDAPIPVLYGERVDEKAPLTRQQRLVLRAYIGYLERPPTLLRALIVQWRILTVVGVSLAASLVLLALGRKWSGLGLGLISYALGVFVMLFTFMRSFIRQWPLYRRVLNWELIRELLQEDEKRSP